MGGVQQHDVHEVCCQAGRQDAALKALLHQHGDAAGVVDMSVGHQHIINAAGMEGQCAVIHLVSALLQTAVDKNFLSVDLQTVTAAGHALVSAVKAQLHNGPPLFDLYTPWARIGLYLDDILTQDYEKYNVGFVNFSGHFDKSVRIRGSRFLFAYDSDSAQTQTIILSAMGIFCKLFCNFSIFLCNPGENML